MAVQLVTLVAEGHWQHVFLVAAVMAVIATPELLRDRLPVEIPSEIQIAAVLFIFATLFLGEVRDYYERIWWWDLALHASAGLLFGLVGFLIVYFLNESGRYEVRLRASFVANLNGDRFVSDPHTRLREDDCVLILSADAGG